MMATEYVTHDGRKIEVETLESRAVPKRRKREEHHIGCPVGWLKRVLPLVNTKEQLPLQSGCTGGVPSAAMSYSLSPTRSFAKTSA